jgi:cell wall-associated NlpC family hydrolase
MRSLRTSLLAKRAPLVALAGVAVLAVPVTGAGTANADPIDDQRDKVEYYADQLEQLEEDTYRLAEDYDIALDELDQLESAVVAAEDAVAEKQEEVAALQAELADVAVQTYLDAGSGGMGVFSDPDTLSEQLQREELARVALNSGTSDSDDLEQAANDLAEEQENLEDQRAAAEHQAEEVVAAREATEAQTAEFEDAKTVAEAELGDLIREEQERRARESYERIQREAAAAQARAEAQAQAQQQAQQEAQTAQPTGGGNSTAGNSPSSGGGGASTDSRGGGSSSPAAPAAPATPSIPAASSRAGTAVAAAMTQQGVPWVFGKAEPGVAFDCSGLTSWSWGRAGVSLPHQSAQQYSTLPHVPSAQAQPGDLIFFYSPISHVGMYIGGGQMIHSPNSGSTVHIRSVNWGNVVGVGRPS